MRSSRVTLVLGALLVLAGVGGVALAQDVATVVENRQTVMKAQGRDLGAIKAYLDDKGDLPSAQAAGADLVQQIAKIPTLFPKDTGMTQLELAVQPVPSPLLIYTIVLVPAFDLIRSTNPSPLTSITRTPVSRAPSENANDPAGMVMPAASDQPVTPAPLFV